MKRRKGKGKPPKSNYRPAARQPRVALTRASRPGKRTISELRQPIARATRPMKPPKSKTLAARARKLPKFIRVKPRKKIGAEIATVKRKRTRSVFRRVKSALRRLGGTKHRVGTRKRSIRLIPAKARPRKTTKIRLIRAHASMRFFSAGRAVRVTVSRKTASVVGSYLASVRKLLDTNDPRATGQFTGRSVKDVRGNIYPLETNPNTLYRLNASVEPFEEVYRLLA